MPTPDFDDERFGVYLKQFRPLAPEPLPIEKPGRAARRRFVLVAGFAAAAILVIAVLALHSRTGRPDSTIATESTLSPEHLVNTQPLTIRSANALLATAPSFKAAVDKMAFKSQVIPLPKGKHSALDVLSKEKTKL